MNKFLVSVILFISLFLIHHSTSYAQIFGGGTIGSSTSGNTSAPTISGNSDATAYYYGKDQGVLIDVNLWGQVRKPGKYFIPYTTDLISLISIAGGPTDIAKLDEVRVIRYAVKDTTVIEKIARVNIVQFIEYGDQGNLPQLIRGDTVIIPGDALSVFQTFVSIAASIGVIVNTFALVALLQQRTN